MLRHIWRAFKPTDSLNIDTLRNEGIVAWVRTYPVDDRLEAFLQTIDPALRAPVAESGRQALHFAQSLLEEWAAKGSVDREQFGAALAEALSEKFGWIDERSIGALRGHTYWYAWHEGY